MSRRETCSHWLMQRGASIGAPARNEARQVVAAVNLAAHTSMISLSEIVDALSPHLVSTADRISARLGYRRDDE
jgi:DNA-binding IclR family transcriptional regulator